MFDISTAERFPPIVTESEHDAVGVARVVVVVAPRGVDTVEVGRIPGVGRARPPVGGGAPGARCIDLDPGKGLNRGGLCTVSDPSPLIL